jgi:hypothetical protein
MSSVGRSNPRLAAVPTFVSVIPGSSYQIVGFLERTWGDGFAQFCLVLLTKTFKYGSGMAPAPLALILISLTLGIVSFSPRN